MAKQTIELTPEVIAEIAKEPDDEQVSDVEQQLDTVFEAVGDDPEVVRVKCYAIKSGEYEFLFNELPAGLGGIDERLRDEYGSGLYELRIIVNGHIKRRLKVPVGRTLADRMPKPIKPDGIKPGEVLGMIREMQKDQMDQFKLMMENVTARMDRPAPEPPRDPFEMQTSLMAMLVQMKDFLKPASAPNPQNPINLLKDVLGLTEEVRAMSGDAGPGALLANVAKETLPGLLQLANIEAAKKAGLPMTPATTTEPPQTPENQGLMERYNQPAPPPQAGAPRASVTPPTPNPEEKPEVLQQLFVAKAIERLLPMAQAGRRPEVYAEVLLDMAEQYNCEPWAVEFICSETFLEQLTRMNPAVATYPEWFKQLRAAVVEMTTPEEDPGLTAAPTAANVLYNVDVKQQKSVVGDSGRGDGDAGDFESDVEISAPIQEEPSHT